MKRIAIFGGSFDPVHLGHIELARSAKEAAHLDRVIFMPCWQSPFKNSTIATGQQRYDMLVLSIEEQGLGHWAEVSEYEVSRPEPSYSWQTVQHFQESYHECDVQWHWVLGTDQWEVLEKWAEPEKLRQQLTFVVMTREGKEVNPKKGWRSVAVPFSHPASSTKIRAEFQAHKNWLSKGVQEYCLRHSIYSEK